MAQAQPAPAAPDWKELDAPPPPALKSQGLVPLDVRNTDLSWGVDPGSISIGTDRIVRYVVIAKSAAGAFNAMYEGLRCSTAEVKVYARHSGSGDWVPSPSANWKPVQGSGNTRHSLAIARGGACMGDSPNSSAVQIARDLGAGGNHRFRNEVR